MTDTSAQLAKLRSLMKERKVHVYGKNIHIQPGRIRPHWETRANIPAQLFPPKTATAQNTLLRVMPVASS